MPKPGWKTSELVVVVVAAILSVVVATGYISPEQAIEVESAVAEIIDAITRLVGALAPIVGGLTYVWSRTKVKVGK
jgi:hypothetical protein